MDFKINWSQRALEDLREIAAYIGQDNPAAALAWGDELFRHIEVLRSFPLIGPAIPASAAHDVRRIVYGDYLVFYRVRHEVKSVELLTVWHAARGIPESL